MNPRRRDLLRAIGTESSRTRRRGRTVVTATVVVAAAMVGCAGTGERGTLMAIRNSDGEVLWEHRIEPNPTQVLSEGDVVIAAGVHGCDGDGRIVAVDALTGEEKWSAPFEGGFSQSTSTDDLVVTSARGGVVARRLDDGTQQWRSDRFGDAQLQVAAGADTVVIGANDPGSAPLDAPRIVAVDAATGETRWVTSLDGLGGTVDVAVVSDVVVIRAYEPGAIDVGRTTIVALGLADGAIRWLQSLGVSDVLPPLLVSADAVVVETAIYESIADGATEELPPSSSVVILETDTGMLRWRIDRGVDLDDPGHSGVAAHALSDVAVVGRIGSELIAWNVLNGDQLWSATSRGGGGGGVGGGAWVAGDRVLASTPPQPGDGQGLLEALTLATGEEQWSQEGPGEIAAAAATVDVSFVATWGSGNGCG